MFTPVVLAARGAAVVAAGRAAGSVAVSCAGASTVAWPSCREPSPSVGAASVCASSGPFASAAPAASVSSPEAPVVVSPVSPDGTDSEPAGSVAESEPWPLSPVVASEPAAFADEPSVAAWVTASSEPSVCESVVTAAAWEEASVTVATYCSRVSCWA